MAHSILENYFNEMSYTHYTTKSNGKIPDKLYEITIKLNKILSVLIMSLETNISSSCAKKIVIEFLTLILVCRCCSIVLQ